MCNILNSSNQENVRLVASTNELVGIARAMLVLLKEELPVYNTLML